MNKSYILKSITYLALILLLALLVATCASFQDFLKFEEKKFWKETRKKDTIDTYKHYLNNYSDGMFAKDARFRLIELLWSKSRIYIRITESFGEANDVALPFVEDIAEFCEILGIRDVLISVRSERKALRANYTERGYLYTGADLSGNILLKDLEGKEILRGKRFNTKTKPPNSVILSEISPGPVYPSDAPFNKVYRKWLPIFAETLGEVYGLESLLPALASGNSRVCSAAKEALASSMDSHVAELLIEALRDGYYSIRSGAAWVLGEVKDFRAEKPLIAALKEKDSDFREEAAKALDKLGWQPKTDTEKGDYLVAKKAWDKCVKLGQPAIEPLIIVARNDENSWVRMEAAKALGKMGAIRAIEPLEEVVLNDNDRRVRKEAKKALKKIKQET